MSRERDNRKRNQRGAAWAPVCRNCGQRGLHYFPASLGEPGFYACKTYAALTQGLAGLIETDAPRPDQEVAP